MTVNARFCHAIPKKLLYLIQGGSDMREDIKLILDEFVLKIENF
jgi:hypothetical protein